MTEPYNPFGAVEEAPAFPEDDTAGGKRNLVALGGLGAVLVAGAAYFLVLSGGDATEDALAIVPRTPAAAAPAAVASPAAVKLPVATKVQLGRNPFKALYVQPAAVAEAPAPAAPATPVAVGGGTTIVVGGGGTQAPTGGGTQAPTSGGGTAAPAPKPAVKEYKLVLTRVFGDEGSDLSAVFTIDGKQQTAKVGSVFGPTAEIKLLSLQEGPKEGRWTAVLQVGDGDPFDVVTGTKVYVP